MNWIVRQSFSSTPIPYRHFASERGHLSVCDIIWVWSDLTNFCLDLSKRAKIVWVWMARRSLPFSRTACLLLRPHSCSINPTRLAMPPRALWPCLPSWGLVDQVGVKWLICISVVFPHPPSCLLFLTHFPHHLLLSGRSHTTNGPFNSPPPLQHYPHATSILQGWACIQEVCGLACRHEGWWIR